MKTIFKAESTVLFQGDSITDWGRDGGLLMETICFRKEACALGKGYAYRAAKIYELLFPNHRGEIDKTEAFPATDARTCWKDTRRIFWKYIRIICPS